MSMPTSPTRLLTCGNCRANLPYEPEQAGTKCRCGSCGKILVIPHDNDDKPKLPVAPKFVSFSCQVCQTVLSARVEHEGKKAKCPDCYTLNVVPPPPKEKKKQTPIAMHGQQYGLWEVDEAPLPEDLAKKLPKFFPVYCSLCNTLMHARPKQIGTKLKCPDCGTKTTVLEPPPEKQPKSVLVPDGEEYQLDETAAPEPRPVPVPVAVLESEKIADYRDQLQKEFGERPKLPRLPTLQGVMKMLVRDPVIAWWLGLSLATFFSIQFATEAMAISGASLEAVIGIGFTIIASVLGFFSLCALSAVWCGILTDSSDGHDRLFNEPSGVPWSWFGEMFYIVVAAAMAILPGTGIGMLVSKFGVAVMLATGLAGAVSFVLSFPIILLSMLEHGSPFGILSPRILNSLLRRPVHWLLFFIQTALLIASCAGAGVYLLPDYLYLMCPLVVAASFIYFRLLGRLAWWLAESLPAE